MKITEVYKLRDGSPVWVWVIHFAKGRWWPGVVETIRAVDDRPRIVVKFECRATKGQRSYPAVRAGIVTTAMRYLEPRDPNIEAIDEPHFIPASLLGHPEELELVTPTLSAVLASRRNKANGRHSTGLRSRSTKQIAKRQMLDEGNRRRI
jgi:hypothetical protein